MNDHEKSIEMIEQDMARSRAEIGRTTEALKAKMDPDNIADVARQAIMEGTNRVEDKVKELAESAGGRVDTLGERAVDYFYQNPLPALMVGMGVGLLISLAERDVFVPHTVEPRGPVESRLNQKLAGSPKLMKARRKTVRQARHINRQHPLLLGMAVLGVGVLLGTLLPATRREDKLMGPARDKLMETSKETAQQAMQQAKSAVDHELDKRKADMHEMKETVEETALRAYNAARSDSMETLDQERVTTTTNQVIT